MAAPDRSRPNKEFPLKSGCSHRIALVVAYNGKNLHGWQRQLDPELPTAQGVLEQALAKIACHDVHVYCAGRTDAGVHAVAQVVHFDTSVSRDAKAWVQGTNSHMPQSVRVVQAVEVTPLFHARYSAISRTYQYFIYNDRVMLPVMSGAQTLCRPELDHQMMNASAQALVGEHDFSSYRAAGCQSSTPMRELRAISVTRNEKVVCIEVTANAFLLHMMRNIVGALVAVGEGRRPEQWIGGLLEARDRTLGEPTAKPDGLYLQKVEYPDCFPLASQIQTLPF